MKNHRSMDGSNDSSAKSDAAVRQHHKEWDDFSFFLILATFAVSLFLPAISLQHPSSYLFGGPPLVTETVGGWGAFTMGWAPYPHVWFANILLVAGLRLLWIRRYAAAAVSGGVATLLAGAALIDTSILSFHAGYFCWLASMLLLAAMSSLRWWLRRRGSLIKWWQWFTYDGTP